MSDDKKTPFDPDDDDSTPLGDSDEHSDASTQKPAGEESGGGAGHPAGGEGEG